MQTCSANQTPPFSDILPFRVSLKFQSSEFLWAAVLPGIEGLLR